MRAALIFALVLNFLLSGPLQAEGRRLYRWTDQQGVTHYSDRVPPEESRRERSVLNDQGMTVDKLEAAKTPEEIAEEKRLEALRREQLRREQEQSAYDRMLLSTFQSVEDLIETRDSKIEAIDYLIHISQNRRKQLNRRLASLVGAAAEHERAGEPVPEKLEKGIQEVHDQIAQTEAHIAKKREEQQAIREEYAKHIERYREILAEREQQQ